MIKSVYLAARFSRLPELNGYRAILEAEGIDVTSRWLLGGHEWTGTPDDEIPIDHLAGFAADDLADIDRADVVIAFTESPRSGPARGGRHFEAGYAYATGKPLIIVGHVENVFYALPDVIRCATWEECHQLLLNAEHVVSTETLADETGGVIRRDDGVTIIALDVQDPETSEITAITGEGMNFAEAMSAFFAACKSEPLATLSVLAVENGGAK